MEALVSVIVPVYKVEAYLDATVSCLLKQTYRNLEIILVDDGSPDRCGEMCDEYARHDERVKVIHKANGGLSSARNAGTSVCKGEYITYLDSDDLVSADYIEYLMRLLAEYGTDMAFCMVRNFRDGETPVYDMGFQYPQHVLSRHEAMKKFFYMRQMRTGVGGKLFRACLKDALRFTEGIYYEDAEPMCRVLKRCDRVAFGEAYKGGYRQRKNSIQHQPFTQKQMDCVTEWSRIYADVLAEEPALRVPAASRYLSACSHTFFMIPSVKGHEQESRICWDGIRRTRWTVLKDPHARKKAWFCALLSLSGMRFTHWVGRKALYH